MSNPVLKQGLNFEAFIGWLLSDDQTFVSFFASHLSRALFSNALELASREKPFKSFPSYLFNGFFEGQVYMFNFGS